MILKYLYVELSITFSFLMFLLALNLPRKEKNRCRAIYKLFQYQYVKAKQNLTVCYGSFRYKFSFVFFYIFYFRPPHQPSSSSYIIIIIIIQDEMCVQCDGRDLYHYDITVFVQIVNSYGSFTCFTRMYIICLKLLYLRICF